MSPEPLLFWIFAAMCITGGLMAVLLPRIVHAVFSLFMCLAGVAAIYAVAGADFLAVAQLVIYVGGVIILFSFGVLLTGRTASSLGPQEVRNRPFGVLLAAALFLGLMSAISAGGFKAGAAEAGEPTTAGLGKLLLGDYIIAFEFASVLLLMALVGAAFLVRRVRS